VKLKIIDGSVVFHFRLAVSRRVLFELDQAPVFENIGLLETVVSERAASGPTDPVRP